MYTYIVNYRMDGQDRRMRYYSNQPLDEFDIREMLNNERGEDAYYLSSEETIDASIKMVDGVPTPEEGGHANDIPKE